MSQNLNSAVAVIGIDIGKNSFHVVGLDDRGAIVLRQKWSRGQIEARLPPKADMVQHGCDVRFVPTADPFTSLQQPDSLANSAGRASTQDMRA
jgi:hypothetical protein